MLIQSSPLEMYMLAAVVLTIVVLGIGSLLKLFTE